MPKKQPLYPHIPKSRKHSNMDTITVLKRTIAVSIPREKWRDLSDEQLDSLTETIDEILDKVMYSERELQTTLERHFSLKSIQIPVKVEVE